VNQAYAFLHSSAIQRFGREYHRASIINDGGDQTVPRYDESIIGLQEYPEGKALIAYMDGEPWGTTLNLYFSFDRYGHLRRHEVHEHDELL